ncbi:MAG TPA: membrane protein insertase YidC [Thermoanaerobaculia bacterium]|jgi:YidC/Oxa1 family membrane protein insertase
MEKRLLLAAALSLAVLMFWEWAVPKPPRPVPPPRPASGQAAAAAPTASAAASAGAAPEPAPPAAAAAPESAAEETAVTLENDVFRARFSNRGAALQSFVLTHYTDEQKRPLELIRTLPPELPRPFGLDFGKDAETTRRVANALFVVERDSDKRVRFRYADGKIAVTKEIAIQGGYLFDVKVGVSGQPGAFQLLAGPGLGNPTETERASRYVMPASAVAASADGMKVMRPEKAQAAAWPLLAGGFAGVEDNYFLEVFLPRAASTANVLTFSLPRPEGKPAVEIATGISGQGTLDARAFFGPKDVSILESYGLGLERTVDFGWYGILARPLLWMMKQSYAIVHNWGVAILVVTFLIRLLLFPLTAKSYTSMKKMQKLAPKMNAIRDKYKKAKTDAAQRQKMNTELMALYQSEGYNPMSGCFPVLLQLPILVAFYNVLSKTIELRHAPFFLWIKDLSAMDGSYVLVILMIVSMYVQQAMTPSTMDPAQKKVFMFMPILWAFFLKDMPSGLVLYWLFSNVLTIVQQLVMNRLVKEDPAPPSGGGAKALKQARA